jgi:hypothetical protein
VIISWKLREGVLYISPPHQRVKEKYKREERETAQRERERREKKRRTGG